MAMASAESVKGSPARAPVPIHVGSSVITHKHIIWGFAVGVLTLSVAAFFYLFIKMKFYLVLDRRRKQKEGNLDAEEKKLRRFQLEELQKATGNFSREWLLGSGGFGDVYRGTFDGEGVVLAIKKARSDSYTSTEEFRNEVKLLSKVKHKNLVNLVGFCEENAGKNAEKILVYEYVPNGSLLDYIIGRGRRSLTWRERVKIAIGAAKGIAYLHEGMKPISIIHRDIKPSNILIGEGFEPKVCDFGLVKTGPTGDQSHVSSQVKGTPGYLDPVYISSFHLTTFSDVYSFGVILLQLVAARPAVDSARNRASHHIIEWARPSLERGMVEDILDANLLLEPCNMEMMLKMGTLGLECVGKVPKERPTMTRVWQELEAGLYASDYLIPKQPRNHVRRLANISSRRLVDMDSLSLVSIDGVGLERFHVEMDSLSFKSTSLRCFEAETVSIDIEASNLREISEEKRVDDEDMYLSP